MIVDKWLISANNNEVLGTLYLASSKFVESEPLVPNMTQITAKLTMFQ
jgi:hypothetical protein